MEILFPDGSTRPAAGTTRFFISLVCGGNGGPRVNENNQFVAGADMTPERFDSLLQSVRGNQDRYPLGEQVAAPYREEDLV